MIKNANSILIVVFGLFISFPLLSQQTKSEEVDYNSFVWKKQSEKVNIQFDIDWNKYSINKDQSLILTPSIINADETIELPSVIINGKRKNRSFKMYIALNNNVLAQNVYEIIQYGEKILFSMTYSYELPYEKWMTGGKVFIKEELSGCGKIIINKRIISKPLKLDYYEMNLLTAYIKPEVEEIKSRSESREVFWDFPVTTTAILPEFGNNLYEVSKIETNIKDIETDKNLTVTEITIKGYASPEGRIKLNEHLSQGRAEALRKYLKLRTSISSTLCKVEYGGEEWKGLVTSLGKSDITNKNEVIAIIENTYSIEERKQKIQRLDGGKIYKRMLNELYPLLRRVICQIEYSVRGFSIIEEGKEVIKTRSQLLSLEEMFLIANTYPVGSPEYMNVFEVAVHMYPNDEIANLNAGSAAILQNDWSRAEKYLQKANKATPEFLNNMGVVNLLNENYEAAYDLLKEASSRGLIQAQHNLIELERKLETIR